MKILGNRVLVSKIEEEKKEGFQTVEVQDSFVNKGRIEMLGGIDSEKPISSYSSVSLEDLGVNDIILFAKYSPDTQDIKHEGKDMKIVNVDDILAIL